jgi:predicted lactoylglutathione lyase
MLFDHVDLRVSDLAKVRPLYDALLPAMGYSRTDEDAVNENFHHPELDRSAPFFALMTDLAHRPNGSRIALRAQSRAEVDRLAAIALAAGAQAFEAPADYDGAAWYYASFFEDADGNKLEICFRAD